MLVNLLAAFDRERFEVEAVSLYPEGGTILEHEIREKGLRVRFLKKRRGPDPKMISRLHHLLCVFRPDIVHTHRYGLRYTLVPSLLYRVPVQVHTAHNVAHRDPGCNVNR